MNIDIFAIFIMYAYVLVMAISLYTILISKKRHHRHISIISIIGFVALLAIYQTYYRGAA